MGNAEIEGPESLWERGTFIFLIDIVTFVRNGD